jgi:TRAP transporter TAXI family solute receptor
VVHLVTCLARRLRLPLAVVMAALVATGCARGPDETQVRDAVQQQLDAALGGRILAVKSLVPAGSAPAADREGRVKYFNAQLEFARDYDFTNWNAHSVSSLGALLGAGPKGVIGLAEGGNRVGDRIGVYGSATFEKRGDRWELVPSTPLPAAGTAADVPAAAITAAVQPRPHEVPPPSPAQAAHAKLGELLTLPGSPGVTEAERDEILREELDRAYREARRRIEHKAGEIAVAGGPPGGAYAETLAALEARALVANVALTTLATEGSVGNIRLLADHSAEFAIVQNDIARSAYAGRGRFVGAPQRDLRAVASLFPETIQLVTRANAGIAGVADLRGKRVGIGPPGSGTRANALAILAANGMPDDALAATFAGPLPEAANALAKGSIDALFVTMHAPAPELARLAASTPIAWVPIGPSRELVDSGLVPITMPARTYAGQATPIPTLAAIALVVTRGDVPAAQVERVLSLLFEGKHAVESAAVSRIAIRTARTGVDLPWLPAADAWLAARGSPAPAK